MIIPPLPEERAKTIDLVRGPNIKPLPLKGPLPERLVGPRLIKVGDNVTTDDILPAGAKVLALPFKYPCYLGIYF